jgi:hypothetical protein
MFCSAFSFHRWLIYIQDIDVLQMEKQFMQYIKLIVLAVGVDLVAFCR